jgi:hypothetical protein
MDRPARRRALRAALLGLAAAAALTGPASAQPAAPQPAPTASPAPEAPRWAVRTPAAALAAVRADRDRAPPPVLYVAAAAAWNAGEPELTAELYVLARLRRAFDRIRLEAAEPGDDPERSLHSMDLQVRPLVLEWIGDDPSRAASAFFRLRRDEAGDEPGWDLSHWGFSAGFVLPPERQPAAFQEFAARFLAEERARIGLRAQEDAGPAR